MVFDGASINEGATCGAGGSMKKIVNPDIRWFFNCRSGSNTKAELVGVWTSFILANLLDIRPLHMVGDSKVVMEWMQRKGNLLATRIEGWKCRVRILEKNFQEVVFQHIYIENKM